MLVVQFASVPRLAPVDELGIRRTPVAGINILSAVFAAAPFHTPPQDGRNADCDGPIFDDRNHDKNYQETKPAGRTPELAKPCATRLSGDAAHARQPCCLIRSTSDLGQWLCVPRFRVVGLFQALLTGNNSNVNVFIIAIGWKQEKL